MVNNIILNNSINNVKLGDNQIFKIFKGTDLVWSTSIPIAPSLYTGLIANYKLDEAATPTPVAGRTVIDETGNHNGIINGTPTLGVAANLGTGINFNNDVANFIDLGTRNLIGGKAAFTIAAWNKVNNTNTDGNLYGAWTPGTRICSFSNNNFAGRYLNYIYIAGAQKGGAFSFTAEQWGDPVANYQLMISTYDGSTFRTFVNDYEAAESYPMTGSVQVGTGENEGIGRGFNYSNRLVSSLQIWDRALNADERTNMYNGGMGIIL